MQHAPVTLFVYKRLWHTIQTLRALARNAGAQKTDLIVYSDGPKGAHDREAVALVRNYLRDITGFRSSTLVERRENLGLSKSIITGVTETIDRYGRVIVVEDDIVTSRHFLSYMNDALELYAGEERVVSVHGYVYPVASPLPSSFFLRGADCWGWGTWKRGWAIFDADGERLLARLKEKRMTRQFDFDGSYPFTRMLQRQIEGKNDSWAIRWYAAAFLEKKLTLYPGESLVHNIGLDGSGTNSASKEVFSSHLASAYRTLCPIPVTEDVEARKEVARYFRRMTGKRLVAKIRSYFR